MKFTEGGHASPPQTPLINVVQKTNDFLHLFLSTAQKEGCAELRSRGRVPKSGLIVNKAGKIVSKTKSVEELKTNRFGKPAE
jgi:hypothetical protein